MMTIFFRKSALLILVGVGANLSLTYRGKLAGYGELLA